MAITDPVFQVTADGITAPSYDEIHAYFQSRARDIFGSDINIDEDTQDGQLIALVAASLHDANSQAIATYNAFSPLTAKGVALDNAVAVNGVKRKTATHSQVDLHLIGQAGTIITNGIAVDSFENRWALPSQVVIPVSGEITVTATAQEAGAIEASPGSVSKIGTPTLGWQSVTNRSSATVGVDAETDAQLQVRQAKSTALPSISLWDGILSSLLDLDGVARVSGVKNDHDDPDSNGIPGHTIAMIVDGGEVDDIATTIFLKKGEGVGTYGSVGATYIDSYGFPNDVYFSRPEIVDVSASITIIPAADYLSTVTGEIKERIADYINSLPIGESVNIGRVLASAIMQCPGVDDRFSVVDIKLGKGTGAQAAASVEIAWNEAASCDVENVTVTVQS